MDVELHPIDSSRSVNRTGSTLDQCRDIENQLDDIDLGLDRLQTLQSRSLNDADEGDTTTNRQIDALNNEILSTLTVLTISLKKVAQRPDAGSYLNLPQIRKLENRLKETAAHFRSIRSSFQAALDRDQIRRYRIVFPGSSEGEARQAIEDQQGSVFNNALMNSDRHGQARSVLRTVEARHQEIIKIERQMVELGELFQEMNIMVAQQNQAVTNIEQHGEEVYEHTNKANEQLNVAIKSAKARNRKKWWCLWIFIAIILIIGIVITIVIFAAKAGCQADKAAKITPRGICAIVWT